MGGHQPDRGPSVPHPGTSSGPSTRTRHRDRGLVPDRPRARARRCRDRADRQGDNRTPAQVTLRWHIRQRHRVPQVGDAEPDCENFAIFTSSWTTSRWPTSRPEPRRADRTRSGPVQPTFPLSRWSPTLRARGGPKAASPLEQVGASRFDIGAGNADPLTVTAGAVANRRTNGAASTRRPRPAPAARTAWPPLAPQGRRPAAQRGT